MAWIIDGKNGSRTVQYQQSDGKRPKIALGKVTMRVARDVLRRVELLVMAKTMGTAIDGETAGWLAKIDSPLHDRLVALDLAAPRVETKRLTIAEAYNGMTTHRQDVKPATRAVWKQAYDSLSGHFGADRKLDAITPAEADGWRQAMIGQGLAEATVRKRVGNAKLIFKWAIDNGGVDANPLSRLASAAIPGDQKPYVTADTAKAVMDQLPDSQWRLLFALGRFAGLRLPSEAFALRWDDVDWERKRINIRVPKLEHIPGKATRPIPIFEDLEPYLLDAFETAREGDKRAVQINTTTDTHVRRIVLQAIERAGVTPWKCLFHSLRASCETDLMRTHPIHVVARWIGHDLRVAERHYLQVTDDDYRRATRHGRDNGEGTREGTEGNGRGRKEPERCTPTRTLRSEKPRSRSVSGAKSGRYRT